MNLRTPIDPISHREVPDPENHPCVYEGDGDNGIEIYFENEANRQAYLNMSVGNNIALKGNDSKDYMTEG